jgi:hypothetical protein
MSLADRLTNTTNGGRAVCKYRAWLNTLNPETQAAVANAMADRNAWTDAALFRELAADGLDVHVSTLSNHRRGLCLGCKNL